MKFSKPVLESFSSAPSLQRRNRGPWNQQVLAKPFHPDTGIRRDETTTPTTSTTDLSHRFLIYRNTVSPLPHNRGFKWTIDLWVLPPTARGQGIGTRQVRYLLQRHDIRILEVGNAANYSFWKRFQRPTIAGEAMGRLHEIDKKFDRRFSERFESGFDREREFHTEFRGKFERVEDSDCRGYMLLKNDTSVDFR
jgi:hypothetical protein